MSAKRKVKTATVTIYYPGRDRLQTKLVGDTVVALPNAPELGTTVFARDRHHDVIGQLYIPAGVAYEITYGEEESAKPKVKNPVQENTIAADTVTYGPPDNPAVRVGVSGIKVVGLSDISGRAMIAEPDTQEQM